MSKNSQNNCTNHIKIINQKKERKEHTISNNEFILNVNKGLFDPAKHIAEFNITLSSVFTDEIMENQKKIEAMLEPFTRKDYFHFS